MKVQTEISISFESVFGSGTGEVPLAQLEPFLDKVVQDCFQRSQMDPHELIRVVDGGKITWMTVQQADEYIQSMDEGQKQAVQKKIQDSLRGKSTVLSQELRILLLLAFGTVKRYRQEALISIQELQRSEMTLNRLSRGVYNTLEQLRQVEIHMKEIRKKNPVVHKFEKKMAQFLTWQKEGENQKAAILAKDLVGLKKKYIVVSKVLNNDKNLSQQHRLEVQRHKKSILSQQRYLAAQREGMLHDEIKDLRQNIQNIKAVLEKESGDERKKYEQLLQAGEVKQDKNQNELRAVQREQVLLEKQEKQTEDLISSLEEEVSTVHSAGVSKPSSQATEKPSKSEPTPETQPHDEEPQKSTQRMVRSYER